MNIQNKNSTKALRKRRKLGGKERSESSKDTKREMERVRKKYRRKAWQSRILSSNKVMRRKKRLLRPFKNKNQNQTKKNLMSQNPTRKRKRRNTTKHQRASLKTMRKLPRPHRQREKSSILLGRKRCHFWVSRATNKNRRKRLKMLRMYRKEKWRYRGHHQRNIDLMPKKN